MKKTKWYKDLYELVCHCWEDNGPTNRNFCKIEKDQDCFYCEFSPSLQSVYGGPKDGSKIWQGFYFHIDFLLGDSRFNIQDFKFYSPTRGNKEHCPSIIISGFFKGKALILVIHSRPSIRLKPNEIFDTLQNKAYQVQTKKKD